jgi:hypothetical protein
VSFMRDVSSIMIDESLLALLLVIRIAYVSYDTPYGANNEVTNSFMYSVSLFPY